MRKNLEDPQNGGNKQFLAARCVPTGQASTSIELPEESYAAASACCSVVNKSTYLTTREIAIILCG